LLRELVPGLVWGFEAAWQGLFYVARADPDEPVVRLREGLLLYAPVAPTAK